MAKKFIHSKWHLMFRKEPERMSNMQASPLHSIDDTIGPYNVGGDREIEKERKREKRFTNALLSPAKPAQKRQHARV